MIEWLLYLFLSYARKITSSFQSSQNTQPRCKKCVAQHAVTVRKLWCRRPEQWCAPSDVFVLNTKQHKHLRNEATVSHPDTAIADISTWILKGAGLFTFRSVSYLGTKRIKLDYATKQKFLISLIPGPTAFLKKLPEVYYWWPILQIDSNLQIHSKSLRVILGITQIHEVHEWKVH
jgi:hypothetical protein